MKSYAELFETRGSSYHHAMLIFPDARNQEFQQLVSAVSINSDMIIADIPAGGKYLKRFLPIGCTLHEHEPCTTFEDISNTSSHHNSIELLPLPWENDSHDIVFSLAGVHHIEDKRPLFKDINRVTKEDGYFVLSDVPSNSKVSTFLDGFVGDNNSTGHEGVFLDSTTLDDLHESGWEVIDSKINEIHWIFPSRYAMSLFCQSLFDIRYASLQEIEDTIDRVLGVVEFNNGTIGMNWSLMTIISRKQ